MEIHLISCQIIDKNIKCVDGLFCDIPWLVLTLKTWAFNDAKLRLTELAKKSSLFYHFYGFGFKIIGY